MMLYDSNLRPDGTTFPPVTPDPPPPPGYRPPEVCDVLPEGGPGDEAADGEAAPQPAEPTDQPETEEPPD